MAGKFYHERLSHKTLFDKTLSHERLSHDRESSDRPSQEGYSERLAYRRLSCRLSRWNWGPTLSNRCELKRSGSLLALIGQNFLQVRSRAVAPSLRVGFLHTKLATVPQRSDSINDPRKKTVTFVPLTYQQWYVRSLSDSN